MQVLHPQLLLILDGFGHRQDQQYNAIAQANTPNLDKLFANACQGLVDASGEAVGLPDQQMGNSEVGHLNIGAGRVVYQDLTRINRAIKQGEFAENKILNQAIKAQQENQGAIHILGLLSPGGIHSHQEHIFALLKRCQQLGASKVFVHAFLDGRDTPPKSAEKTLQELDSLCSQLAIGRCASICGRYYAMDRDARWDRVELAYDMLTSGIAPFHAKTSQEALHMAYERGETDEFVQPTIIDPAALIEDDDTIILMNFRADRARQLTWAFTEKDFSDFQRKQIPGLARFVSLTQYANTQTSVAFPPLALNNVLGAYLSSQGLSQLRIAETEKYAHVTYFFNGGVDAPYSGEERILVPSPAVATYDLQPEMSVYTVTEKLIAAMATKQYSLIVCNFANADMVGHTGKLDAAIKAIEAIDECVGKIVQACQEYSIELEVTADHGNAELMYDEQSQQPQTAHTSNLVPFLYLGRAAEFTAQQASLADIAPTILYLLGFKIPAEMTGKPLLRLLDKD